MIIHIMDSSTLWGRLQILWCKLLGKKVLRVKSWKMVTRANRPKIEMTREELGEKVTRSYNWEVKSDDVSDS